MYLHYNPLNIQHFILYPFYITSLIYLFFFRFFSLFYFCYLIFSMNAFSATIPLGLCISQNSPFSHLHFTQFSVSHFKILFAFPRYFSPSSKFPSFIFSHFSICCLFSKSNFPSGNVTLFLSNNLYKNSC